MDKHHSKTVGVLYLSYDGMLEPLGQSQVMAYLKRLAINRRIYLISFEKPADLANKAERERIAHEIAEAGISWYPLRYHKRPSAIATLWDIICGITVGLLLVHRHRLAIVHARSYVPSVIALALKRLAGVKYLFDMRGFWADERVDAGLWSRRGMMYLVTKWFERRFLLAADHVVSLTQAAVGIMQDFNFLQGHMPPFTVIPTCVDLTLFKPLPKKQNRVGFVMGYVGSVGSYYLFNEVVACFSQLLELQPDSKLLIVNRGQHPYILERLKAAGVPITAFELTTATYIEVPSQMVRMDAGIFFIKPVFSKQASAPTKLAEFLSCGIPCLSNAGVGDMVDVLEGEQVGVALRAFDKSSLTAGLNNLLRLANNPATPSRCAAAALKHFSLDQGVALYNNIYKTIGMCNKKNLDIKTIKSFGDEWSRFDQAVLSPAEAGRIFNDYFAIFPWNNLPKNATGFDMGCGTGRWARLIAPRIGHLHCIDPSSALNVARKNLSIFTNVSFHHGSVDDAILPPCSQDFGYSLGVLHHVPDTAGAIRSCVELLKPGAPFLLYLYYAFDNRSAAFKLIWFCSDLIRRAVCRLPATLKHLVTDTLALVIYYPLSRIALMAERIGLEVGSLPLSYYRNHSFYTMRTDSRDRFGTPLEKRFTRKEIASMLESAGLTEVRFSAQAPYWCAVGIKQ